MCGLYGSGPQIHISSSFLFIVFQTFLTASWQPQLITYWHVMLNMFRISSNFSSRAANAVLPVNVLPSLMTALGPLWGPLFLLVSVSELKCIFTCLPFSSYIKLVTKSSCLLLCFGSSFLFYSHFAFYEHPAPFFLASAH